MSLTYRCWFLKLFWTKAVRMGRGGGLPPPSERSKITEKHWKGWALKILTFCAQMTLGGGRGNFFLPFTIHMFYFLMTTSPFISPSAISFLIPYLSCQTRNGMRKKGFVARMLNAHRNKTHCYIWHRWCLTASKEQIIDEVLAFL